MIDINIIGTQFWLWTVLDIVIKFEREYFEVKCTCGTKRVVRASSVIKGRSRSCGSKECIAEEQKIQDKLFTLPDEDPINIGDVFKKLTVVGFAEDTAQNNKQYVVQCTCGNKLTVSAYTLKTGRKGSCGISHYALKIGQRFGALMVTAIDPDDPTNITTTCECGEVEQYKRRKLLKGAIKLCLKERVHKRKHPINIGDTFGKLTVIEEVFGYGKGHHRYYKCSCACGSECVKRFDGLVNLTATHCGCSKLVNNPEYKKKVTTKRRINNEARDLALFIKEQELKKKNAPTIKQHINKPINSIFEFLVHTSK